MLCASFFPQRDGVALRQRGPRIPPLRRLLQTLPFRDPQPQPDAGYVDQKRNASQRLAAATFQHVHGKHLRIFEFYFPKDRSNIALQKAFSVKKKVIYKSLFDIFVGRCSERK